MSVGANARLGGLFWLLTMVTGLFAMGVGGRFNRAPDTAAWAANVLAHQSTLRSAIAANLVAGVCYVAATVFVYELLKPVHATVSLLAALLSLVGCAVGAVGDLLHLAPLVILKAASTASVPAAEPSEALALVFLKVYLQTAVVGFLFFGLHCLLVGGLILRSRYLPAAVGALMVSAGLGWLTLSLSSLLSPRFAGSLFPYIGIPGLLGEGSLTLWLLLGRVDVHGWREQAGAAAARALAEGARP